MSYYLMPLLPAIVVFMFSFFLPSILIDCNERSDKEVCLTKLSEIATIMSITMPISCYFTMFRSMNGFWPWQDEPTNEEKKK